MAGPTLIAAKQTRGSDPRDPIWRAYWRVDSRHVFKPVVNKSRLPINYRTEAAALEAAEYTVKAETSR